MRKPRALILVLFAAVAVAGCVTEEPEPAARVRVGMSRDDLRFYFGEPLRVQATESGGEDWYYRFVSWNPPQVDGAVSHDDLEGSHSVSVSMSGLGSSIKEQRPIHLSADGRVIEPIPEGTILGR